MDDGKQMVRAGLFLLAFGVALSTGAATAGVLTTSYPSSLPVGVVASPALESLPGGAAAVDYVDIGDAESEVGHAMAGWGPVEPATSGGVWGSEPTTRVLWEAGTGDAMRSASIDLDFGSTLGTKYLAIRWLDGISYADHFDIDIDGAAFGSVTDGSSGHGETWYDLGAFNVGPLTGVHTVTMTATGMPWSMFNTFGQVGISEMATFIANCCPEPPEDVVANPLLVQEPTGAVQLDFVDIGKPASEAGHAMSGWGPIEPLTTGGSWGGEDDCRVIWEPPAGSTSATIDMDFGEAAGDKYVILRWLDGMANMGGAANDSFTMNIQGVGPTFSLLNGTASHPEQWYFLCAWNVGDVRGVRTITFNATGAAWSAWATYGQVAFSQIAILGDVCDAACGPDTVPDGVGITPSLQCIPDYAVQVDHVDIGDATSEAGHNLSSWGPIEPATTGGSWGGEDDCRVIWEAGTASTSASIDMDFGSGVGNKYLGLRWLDGMANTGGSANDSFDIVIGTTSFGSVTNGTSNHAETWYDLYVWDVGALTGQHTVTLTATGGQWSGFNTFGQVAFSAITTYESDLGLEPAMESLPDCAVQVDFVDIGDGTSEAGHNMVSWGPIEPAQHGGSWGGEDDCRVIWDTGSDTTDATIDMDFGTGGGDKFLALRWLDGMANMGGTADDSFRVYIDGSYFGSMTNGTANHPETWYDLAVWNVGPMTGVHTIKLDATATKWTGWNTYGQVAFSTMATYEEFCETAPPSGVDVQPDLVTLPVAAVTIDYVDIGNAASEMGHNLQGWGGPEPATHGGSWGGEDDCKVIWQNGSDYDVDLEARCATIDMDFGAAIGTKYLVMRWLDGLANDGTVNGPHDSFRMNVSGSSQIYTVHDLTANHGENWYDLCAFDVGEIKGVHTISLCATGGKWASFNTFGQVAFSEMATKVACADCDPPAVLMNSIVRLPDVQGPVTRCVKFTPEDDNGVLGTPVHVDVLFTGTPATGTVTFAADGDWTLLSAKDEQHALSAMSGVSLVDGNYYAEFNLDLDGGDTDNNDLVDIDDVTWLIATFGETADGGSHPWDGTRDADFSNNGVIHTEDYAFITANWQEMGDFAANRSGRTGHVIGGTFRPSLREVKTSVPVAKLAEWVADRADLNRDGVVDVRDVREFEELHGLGNSLSLKIERTTSLKKTPPRTRDR